MAALNATENVVKNSEEPLETIEGKRGFGRKEQTLETSSEITGERM